MLQKAIQVQPNNVDAYNNLGVVFKESEEFQKATTVRDLYDLVEVKIKQGAKIKELEKEAGDDEKARNRLLEQLKKDKEAGTGVYEMSQYEKK